MKTLLIFVLGLLVGVGIFWSFDAFISNPRLVAQTQSETKAVIEQEQLENQKFISATIESISGSTIQATIETESIPQTITIETGPETALVTLSGDATSTKTPISLGDLRIGARITVTSADIIDLTKPIYATEIIAF